MMALKKWVVVTGGASGIGEATARRFAAEGYRVLLADIDATRGAAVGRELSDAGADCVFHALDVGDEAAVAAFAERVATDIGPVDALVGSAGLLQHAVRVAEMDLAAFDRILQVNLRGSMLVSRAFGAQMKAAGRGSIIHLCSLTSLYPSPQPAYAMSKAGLKMLTEIMAAELGPHGVRVNAVAPGYTLTPAMQVRIDRGERNPAAMIEKSALKQLVMPSDVAAVIYFLCSDDARAVTGVVLPIDCGWGPTVAYSGYAAQP
jgi:NAD(P)-dependent dehydrogenase (short-subunit alcohol dehydrogenase family)